MGHPARWIGLGFAVVGSALFGLLQFTPAWIPHLRLITLFAPFGVLFGSVMMLRPGPRPQGEGFDVEDWYDEASTTDKLLYSGVGLFAIALGLWLYFGGFGGGEG